MGKAHVPERLDQPIAIDADRLAAEAVAEAAQHPAVLAAPGVYKLGLALVDDRGGGWTNRCAVDFARRFGAGGRDYGWLAASRPWPAWRWPAIGR